MHLYGHANNSQLLDEVDQNIVIVCGEQINYETLKNHDILR